MVKACNRLAKGFINRSEFDSARVFTMQAVALSAKLNYLNGLDIACSNLAQVDYYQGNYPRALKLFEILLRIRTIRNDKDGMASAYTGLGSIYQVMSDPTRSLQNHLSALRIYEAANDTIGMATSFHNIGNVYYYNNDLIRSKENFSHALQLHRQTGRKEEEASDLIGLGGICYEKRAYEEANKNYLAALKLQEETNDKSGMAYSYNCLALSYTDCGKLEEAIAYHQKAIKIREEIGDQGGLANSYVGISSTYYKQNIPRLALSFAEKGLKLATELGDTEDEMAACKMLSEIFEGLSVNGNKGTARGALDYYKRYIAIKDSMTNEENTKKAVRLEMNYQFEKKEATAKLEQEKKDAVAVADKRKQRIILLAISCFGLLVLGFAVFAWRSFLQKKRANIEITMQKELIEEKQKEILDSIYYARRIQTALMPTERYIAKVLLKFKRQ